MDAPPSSSERKRELAELRSRAYGPDADIHLDASALARLRELEDLSRADAPIPSEVADADPRRGSVADPRAAVAVEQAEITPSVPTGTSRAVSAGTDASGPAPSLPDTQTAADAAITRPRLWRRVPRWAFVAGAAVVGLGIGLALPALMPPHPETVLRSIPLDGASLDFEMYGVNADSPVRYAPFHDLEVWSAETAEGAACLLITTDRREWVAAGCAPQQLDPTADLTIYPGMRPVEGLELPNGSVVRFVLRGDAVEVWIARTAEAA